MNEVVPTGLTKRFPTESSTSKSLMNLFFNHELIADWPIGERNKAIDITVRLKVITDIFFALRQCFWLKSIY